MSRNNYIDFQNIMCKLLDKHAPVKKKYFRANDSPFMTKHLQKIIMNRSRSKNIFFKNKTVENWERYRKLRNECVKLTKKKQNPNISKIFILTFLMITKHFGKLLNQFFLTKIKPIKSC